MRVTPAFKTSAKVTPEKWVQNAVIAQLRFHNWYVQRNQQGLGNTIGRPDLEAYKRGFVLFIEVKSPKGGLRKGQPEYHEALRKHGMTVWVVDDSERFLDDLETLQERLWPGQNMKRLF